MIVFAFKTIFLIGIMSWYSATIFSMINDYFRREFNEYVKIDSPPSRPPPSPTPDTHKSDTIKHTASISSNNKPEMPRISLQFNSTSTAAATDDDRDDDGRRIQAMMTSKTMTVTGHSNQQNNKVLNKPPLIPVIITTSTIATDEKERLVYSDNGRCHFGEYVVQLLSGNPVCMRREIDNGQQ